MYNLETNARYVITERRLKVIELMDVMCVPSIGNKVVLSGRKGVVSPDREDDETVAFIWDIKEGTSARIVALELENLHKAFHSD